MAGAVLVACAGVWIGGVFTFVASIPAQAPGSDVKTDAIVVLTGGSGRLDAGLTLLSSESAKKLFVSGVYRGVDVRKLLEISRRDPEGLSCCIALGYAADSTSGNAEETARWLTSEGYKSIRLVTASYHMPRGLLEFKHAMPGMKILPHPVFPPRFKRDEWWRWPGTASLILAEFHKYIGAALGHAIDKMTQD
ncbi:MAG: YdcF family protein [Rhodospirillales bacterium]|nr:hypothetical protein [Rhodospirillaceae bacterium]MDP6429820.1 YdcF family protein [Rhodospirillales bacterium]MDP6645126.1 YdcF family protein [Rhodospirillales bacterium]MDP6841242.1 YdcF family protein [Rhodospirillales bacterium]